jgi:hypothetical protein
VETCQVGFIRTHHSRDVLKLGPHQQPIQHAQARGGLGAGKDEDGLIRVGDDDLLPLGQVAIPVPATRSAPTSRGSQPYQRPLPLGDFLNHPGVIVKHADANTVTDGHQVSIEPLLFESPSHLADEIAHVGIDSKETTLCFDDQAVEQIRHLTDDSDAP